MDNSQVTIALLGYITSVLTSVIAGYFAIRTAQVEQKKIKKNKDNAENTDNTTSRQPFSLINSLIFTVISIPLAFIFALLGNWISGTPREFLLDDSLDAAVIVPITFFLSYTISANLFIEKTKVTKILFPAIVIGLLFIPFLSIIGFAINYILSPEYLEFRLVSADVASQSFLFRFNLGSFLDSMILAMLSILIGFITGASRKEVVFSIK